MKFTRYTLNTALLNSVDAGLSGNPKSLPSWLLYNEEGDRIFQAIMRMPEYYVTSSEYEILQNHKKSLLNYFTFSGEAFTIVELGSGDGVKTQLLLEYFAAASATFEYVPVDVSAQSLHLLTTRMKRVIPKLKIKARHLHYDEALDSMEEVSGKKIVFFLGANIGNYLRQEALTFMMKVADNLRHDDMALIGFDLKKDPRVVQRAYDDPNGITRAFNLNLLTRINNELGGDFEVYGFDHYATYDPSTGEARSYIISQKKQSVYIDALNKSFLFRQWEPIHTEISQKYDIKMVEDIVSKSGFELIEMFFDSKKYFTDVLVRKK